MRRLTSDELLALSSDLRRRHRPADFGDILERANVTAGFYAVSQGRMQVWREAFAAMSCAQLTHADRVRLGRDPPDFELDYVDHQRVFEIVDAWPMARRPGDQYDDFAERWNSGRSIPVEHCDMEAEINALPADLAAAIAKKMVKSYPRSTILVVDIHHTIFPTTDLTVEVGLARVARSGLTHFAEIWLRMGAHFIRVTPAGATRTAPLAPREY